MAKEQVFQFKKVTLDYELTGGPNSGEIKFFTILPGQAPSEAAILVDTLPASARTHTTAVLPAGTEGSHFRVQAIPPNLSPTGRLKVFGGFVEAIPIGEYFDGGRGEFYDSEFISPGT